MVRRQAALREVQCVAVSDGEALIAHFSHLVIYDINPFAEWLNKALAFNLLVQSCLGSAVAKAYS
jgi:hypothetical protein